MNDRVLVTGAGGGVGQSVLKSLRGTKYEAVAYDSSPYAAGLYMTQLSWVGLESKHPEYIQNITAAVKEFDCKFIIPGHDVEIMPLVQSKQMFSDLGVELVASDSFLISLADDKLETADFLKLKGFDAPKTSNFHDFEWEGAPVVLKPRKGGARSKGTYVAFDEDSFKKFSSLVDSENTVIQEWCPGDEYTCGTLTYNNNFVGAITMKRELRGGDTYKAFSIKNKPIDETLRALCELLQPKGPCNFQLKFHDNRVRIFEINARFSGTTFIRKLCGFDEVVLMLDLLKGGTLPKIEWRELSILRYWSEIVVENSDIMSRP
jgi:carbamoyl-phosphate synthase large subunit